ncbi:hypothetical protein [Halostagnicola kamekurae]|uniref:Uncharacterized protein n=1 Tax=Halostagnicola kamekurae TaxID=619731 RepID=A0A1I6RDS2_9EURY|nr:hypothetical protein [Halostagnicola kamekurae]SFS62891.1 hypothetical protein SAMN04488556_1727 [Halostagnicola kamekurae]
MGHDEVREHYKRHFPDDECVYVSGTGFTDPTKHSYTALGKLPETDSRSYNGCEHVNTHRLVIHTPAKGPVDFLTRHEDMEGFVIVALRLAIEGDNRFGPAGELVFNQEWLEDNLGGPIQWEARSDDPDYVEADD